MLKRRFVVATLAAAVIALLSPAVAKPGTWYWGYATMTSGTTGNPCIFYYPGSACSGWNYWAYVGIDKINGGTVHLGFQNNSWIRGVFLTGWQNTFFTPGEAGCGGCYLRAGVTWWESPDSYLWAQAST